MITANDTVLLSRNKSKSSNKYKSSQVQTEVQLVFLVLLTKWLADIVG